MFLEESGLGRARPDALIEFSRPGGYPELLEIVKAHGYDLARRRDALPTREQVAADWHDSVYRPARTARDQRVSRRFRRAFLREKGSPLRRRR